MRRRYLLLAIVFVLLLIGVSVTLQVAGSGRLVITAAGSGGVDVTVHPESGDSQQFKLPAGSSKTLTLPKGTVRVNASSGKIKSVDVVEIKGWRVVSELSTPSGELRAVQKVGSGSVECPLLKGAQVFSYSCASEGPVYRHVPIDSNRLDPRDELLGGRTFGTLQPYSGGLLGFEFESSAELLYVSPDKQTVTPIVLPAELATLAQTDRPRIIVSDQPEVAYFGLAFRGANRVYLFKHAGDQNPVRLPLDKVIALNDLKFISGFQLLEKTLLIFIGNNDHYEGEEGVNEYEGELQSEEYHALADQTPQHIFEYDLSGKQTRHLTLPGGIDATSGVNKLAGDYYALYTNQGLSLYRYQDEELTFIYTMPDVSDVLAVKDRTYFVVNGTIYTLEPTASGLFSLHSLFSSPALSVSSLSLGSGGLAFTAFSNRTEEQSVLDIFRLLDDRQTTAPFEERFAYDKVSAIITGYDYDDKQIIFYLRVAGSGGGSYDQLLTGMKRALQEQKMDVEGRTVQIGPLN
jgi:hypothetical protein